MNWLDICILAPCIWFLIKGIKNGLIKEIAQIVSIFLSTWIAIKFSNKILSFCIAKYPSIASQTASMTPRLIKVMAFIIILIAGILLIRLLGTLLQKVIEMTALGGVNKVLGAIFGVIKGLLLISILFFICNTLGLSKHIINEKTRSESFMIKPTEQIINFMDKNKSDTKNIVSDLK